MGFNVLDPFGWSLVFGKFQLGKNWGRYGQIGEILLWLDWGP